MDTQTLFNPALLSLGIGLVLGAGLLFLLVKYGIEWLTGSAQSSPQAAQAVTRPRLTGLSWIIALTHRAVSQLTGLVMSFATLIAIVLSIICAVVGITIISYQQYGSLVLTLSAAGATFILALLIENTSINALKTIRLANEEIAEAEQAHYEQMVKQMEEQFEEDAREFAQINQQTLTKEEVQSMERAASLKLQARKQFEKKRRGLMREQTRTARHNRRASLPFAIIGILFSASAGGLFWHTVLASLPLWLNITVGTMFALAVSVTFVQSELLKRIKDDAIAEALRSGEMQNVMLKQQSEEMVLGMVVDTMAAVKQDPATLIEMGTGIKEELKTTIRVLTQQTTARLVEDADHPVVVETDQTAPEIEHKPLIKRQKKEPEWWSHPALGEVLKMHPNMQLKLASWQSSSRISVSTDVAINTLIEITGQSRRSIQNRIKDGTLKATPHNSKLILISSILEWLQIANIPTQIQGNVRTEEIEQCIPETDTVPAVHSPEEQDSTPKDETGAQTHTIVHVQEYDKLSVALAAMRINPAITDEELAPLLGMRRLASARFYRLKAQILLDGEKRNGHAKEATTPSEYPEILA